jgi:hypothetical protein
MDEEDEGKPEGLAQRAVRDDTSLDVERVVGVEALAALDVAERVIVAEGHGRGKIWRRFARSRTSLFAKAVLKTRFCTATAALGGGGRSAGDLSPPPPRLWTTRRGPARALEVRLTKRDVVASARGRTYTGKRTRRVDAGNGRVQADCSRRGNRR